AQAGGHSGAAAVAVAAVRFRPLDGPGRHPCRSQPSGGDLEMRHLRPLVLLLALLLTASCTGDPPQPGKVGAIYPLSGTQGMGGIDEYHGVRVAAELANADGGINGRPVVLDQVDVPEADAAPAAIKALARRGVRLALGSYCA